MSIVKAGLSNCLAVAAVMLLGHPLTAQDAPGGVAGNRMWMNSQSDSVILGNYRTIDLKSFVNSASNELSAIGRGTTFLVLKPNQTTLTGNLFMRFGQITISDTCVQVGPVKFDLSVYREPVILTIRNGLGASYGRRSSYQAIIGDTSLFSLAELVHYPTKLDDRQIRRVEVYLGMKYSIPITQNITSGIYEYLMPDQGSYWDPGIDGYYYEEVIGLGRSDGEQVYQSQTATNGLAYLMLGLDTITAAGDMPNVYIHNRSYIVFSKRKRTIESTILCRQGEANKLTDWRFKLFDWQSSATELVVRTKKALVNQQDTIYLFDGNLHRGLVGNSLNDSIIEYYINVDYLQNDVYYTFKLDPDSTDCHGLQILPGNGGAQVVSAADSTLELIWVNLANGQKGTMNLAPGLTQLSLQEGQYLIAVTEPGSGELLASEHLDVRTAGEVELNFNLYPNPGRALDQIQVEAGSNEACSGRVMILDGTGRLIASQDVEIGASGTVRLRFTLNRAGMYTALLDCQQHRAFKKFIILNK